MSSSHGADVPRLRRSPIMAAGLSVLLLAGGCAHYQSAPLNPEQFASSLEQRSEMNEAGAPKPATLSAVTLEEAEAIALFYNPTLRAARLKALIPAVGARKAGRWDNPEISADVLRIVEAVEEPWIIGSSLAFTIPISGRLSVERSKASAEAYAALVESWRAEQKVLQSLREAWVAWEARERALEATRESLQHLASVTAITQKLEDAGELVAAEAVVFRMAAARANTDLARMEAAAAQARQAVLAELGLLPTTPITFQRGAESMDKDATVSREDLLARNPDVVQSAADYAVAEEALRLEIRSQYPDIQLGPAYGREDAQDRVGVGVSIPVPIFNRNGRAIAEAAASRDAARAVWEEAAQRAIMESSSLTVALAAAERHRTQLHEDLMPLAEEQLEGARRLADQGEVNALLLLEALNAHRDTHIELIDADADVARVAIAIRALSPPPPPPMKKADEKK